MSAGVRLQTVFDLTCAGAWYWKLIVGLVAEAGKGSGEEEMHDIRWKKNEHCSKQPNDGMEAVSVHVRDCIIRRSSLETSQDKSVAILSV
jgi:hypothetical protein